jgi:hypothetical protein
VELVRTDMNRMISRTSRVALVAALSLAAFAPVSGAPGRAGPSALSRLEKVGEVDPRFLSYNIEMVEVTGGNFWRPYSVTPKAGGDPTAATKAYRPPIDLTSRKLRQLVAALGPSYVRYSGTWANATWFADQEDAPAKAPAGFDTVLTRKQWRDAVALAKFADAKIVTSFASSPGTRDAAGVWQTDTAARWLAYTKQIGGTIAAAEYVNEPSVLNLLQPPKGYTAADYRRDYANWERWIRRVSPRTLVLAPGSAELAEPARTLMRRTQSVIENDQLLAADSPKPDVFSFHYYNGVSQRCGGAMMGVKLAQATTAKFLDSVDSSIALVSHERDRLAPGKPIGNTESGEGACGGNPWASTFVDSFRFVDTLGRSARQGVKVFIHNTLAASDYALLEDNGFDPRPNYWASVLWKRTMGPVVLGPPQGSTPEFRIYAHCLVGVKGGVGLAAVNIGTQAQAISGLGAARFWTLAAAPGQPIDTKVVTVNGATPRLLPSGKLGGLAGQAARGSVSVPGRSVTFVAVPGAANRACR